MPVQVLTDVRCYIGDVDATGQTNQIALSGSVVNNDATTFGSNGWETPVGGLKSAKVQYNGFAAMGAIAGLDQVDDSFWGDLIAGVPVPITACPSSGAVGTLAYVGKMLEAEYKTFDKVGALLPFEFDGVNSGPLANGLILHPQGTPRTTTGFGTAVQFPALTSTQHMFAALHVMSVTGTTPTLAVVVQSAPSSGFASPTTRATFNAATANTIFDFQVAGGPITDTWWRVGYTITGSSPSYLFACSAGIQ